MLGLYKEMVVASRSFKHSDPQWFLARVRQEFYKTNREPAERIKWFEVRAQPIFQLSSTQSPSFPSLHLTNSSLFNLSCLQKGQQLLQNKECIL